MPKVDSLGNVYPPPSSVIWRHSTIGKLTLRIYSSHVRNESNRKAVFSGIIHTLPVTDTISRSLGWGRGISVSSIGMTHLTGWRILSVGHRHCVSPTHCAPHRLRKHNHWSALHAQYELNIWVHANAFWQKGTKVYIFDRDISFPHDGVRTGLLHGLSDGKLVYPCCCAPMSLACAWVRIPLKARWFLSWYSGFLSTWQGLLIKVSCLADEFGCPPDWRALGPTS